MLNFVLDVVFPHNACALCREPGVFWSRKPWCEKCEGNMAESRAAFPVCDRCGKYLLEGGDLCADCREETPPFSIARAVGPYENEFKIAIKILKFLCRRYIALRMGEMMAEVVRREPRFWPLDLVVPVPISQANLLERGFNQSEVLARYVARSLKLPRATDLLVRVKETPSQRELSRREREENLRQAFRVTEPERVKGKSVLLVDDVYTTGSTVRECAHALLAAGAIRVAVITWATGKGY